MSTKMNDSLEDVLAEVERATAHFPTWPADPFQALAILGEEFGELTKAVLQTTYEPHKVGPGELRTEAIQTAAMALRFLTHLDGYHFGRSGQISLGIDRDNRGLREAVAWPKADDSDKELGWSWDYKWLESLADATRAAGWDASMEAIDFVLSRVAATQAPPVEWFERWIRNNYQNHCNIAGLCDAMSEAAYGITKEQAQPAAVPAGYALVPVKPTEAMRRAAVSEYEDAMGGARLPDGNNYDEEVVSRMYQAMIDARARQSAPSKA